jgi:hypothetical protein
MSKYGTFKCENCKGVFNKEWSDEEAEAEWQSVFEKHAQANQERGMVCDDCYNEMLDWKPPEVAEAGL